MEDALKALDQIEDPEARVKAKSAVMAAQVRRNKAWAEERRDLARKLQIEEELSYRQIADRLGVTLGIVQDIFREYSGTGSLRPKSDKPGRKSSAPKKQVPDERT